MPVGFSLNYDTWSTPAPFLPTLGLTAVPNIEAYLDYAQWVMEEIKPRLP